MRIANLAGRLTLVLEDGRGADVEHLSAGAFGPDPQSVFHGWGAFVAWAGALDDAAVEPDVVVDAARLGPPVPRPSQVFAIGLNYRAHARETGAPIPDRPVVFTKFASCLTGPVTEVVVPEGSIDWEAELVVVIGRTAYAVAEEQAWDHVAGVMVGNDISDRDRQMADPARQWSLAKSLPGFGPTGPWLVTVDELPDRDDLLLGCSVDGETVQDSRTSDLIFPVARLVAELSASVTLLPGDLIWTGTPSGVALGRPDKPFVRPGSTLRTWIGGVGELEQRFVAPA